MRPRPIPGSTAAACLGYRSSWQAKGAAPNLWLACLNALTAGACPAAARASPAKRREKLLQWRTVVRIWGES